MRFAGADTHRQFVEFAIIDQAGQLLLRAKVPTTREALQAFAREHLGPDVKLAIEACFNTWGVVDVLEPFVDEVVPSNPLRTKAIAQAKVKTDKVDALVLAQLLRCDYLPRVWKPDAATREMRHLCTWRANLVADRTRLKNRIHAILHQRLLRPPVERLFSPEGRAWLAALDLDEIGRAMLDSDLRQLAGVEAELEALTIRLAVRACHDAQVKLLVTIPGVDVAVALGLLSAWGDLSRFRDADHAASYLGLAPSTHQSAEHCYHGRITKQGNSHARWLLVQAAQHLDRHLGPLGVFFRRIAAKKNRNVAVVACARKLAAIAYLMLKSGEPYRYAEPQRVQGKLARLRVAAGRPKRKTGTPKGSPRPAAYGTGVGTRAVPSLAQACTSEGLPAPRPLAPGERRMLADMGLSDHVDSLHQPRRVPRKKCQDQDAPKGRQPAPPTPARQAGRLTTS
jgi:transposase